MSKIVIVNTISTFLLRFAVELSDDDPEYFAEDTFVMEEDTLDEFSQKHLGYTILESRTTSKEEYLKLFDKENPIMIDWTDEQKMRYIVKPKEI